VQRPRFIHVCLKLQLQVGARGRQCNTIFIYLPFFAFGYAPLACNLIKKQFAHCHSVFLSPLCMIATVEMMGNQMAEIEDFTMIPLLVQRSWNKRQLRISIFKFE